MEYFHFVREISVVEPTQGLFDFGALSFLSLSAPCHNEQRIFFSYQGHVPPLFQLDVPTINSRESCVLVALSWIAHSRNDSAQMASTAEARAPNQI